jgi:hypothetical protein
VFDSGYNDWLNFICGVQPGSFCSAFTPIDPSNLNVASIAIGDLAGRQTVNRKVKNVGGKETYTFSYTGLSGITVTPSTASFTINPGAEQSFGVTFQTAGATLNSYVGGQITWTGDKGHVVRLPVVIRPVALAAPTQVSGSYNVTFGYNGAFTATARGLVPAAITAGTVADDPTDGTCSLTSPNAVQIPVTIPAGTTYARYSLFDADVNAGSDIDMCVFQGATLVGSSGTGTSAEEVNFTFTTPSASPIALTVVVQGWGVVGSTPFKLHTWYLGTAAAGNMTVSAPAAAAIGVSGAIDLTFNGLTAGTKYLGSVAYDGASGMPSPTIVTVNP